MVLPVTNESGSSFGPWCDKDLSDYVRELENDLDAAGQALHREHETVVDLEAELDRLREALEQAEVDMERKVDAELRTKLEELELQVGWYDKKLADHRAELRLLWSVIGSMPSSYIKSWSSESETAFKRLPKQPEERL